MPTSMLKDHPEVFQQEGVLRFIDTLHRKMLIMRRKRKVIIITASPAKDSARNEIRLFSFEANQQQEPKRSRYAQKHFPPTLPFRQQFGDDEYVSTLIASHRSPDAFLEEWKVRLGNEGWEELAGKDELPKNSRIPGIRMAAFRREKSGAVVMVQPGPDNGSLGLVTRMQQ